MKKYKIPLTLFLIILIGGIFTLQSCRKFSDFTDIDVLIKDEFNEVSNLSNEMYIDGSVAVPLLNTKFTLSSLIPDLNSEVWIETEPANGNDPGLLHLRFHQDNIFEIEASDIFGTLFTTGLPIPATSLHFNSGKQELDLLNTPLGGHVFFYDPQITLTFNNEIPLEAFVSIDTITYYDENLSAETDAVTNLEHTITGASESKFVINRTTLPIISDIFSPFPKTFGLAMTVGTHTEQTVSNITGNEKISGSIDIDVPFNIRIFDLEIDYLFKFSFGDSSSLNFKQIEGITIKLIFDNLLPFGAEFEIAFCDTTAAGEVDNIYLNLTNTDGTNFNFKPCITDASGKPTTSVKSALILELTDSNIKTLYDNDVSKINLVLNFNTSDSDQGKFAKIYSWCTLGIKFGVKLDYAASSDDF